MENKLADLQTFLSDRLNPAFSDANKWMTTLKSPELKREADLLSNDRFNQEQRLEANRRMAVFHEISSKRPVFTPLIK